MYVLPAPPGEMGGSLDHLYLYVCMYTCMYVSCTDTWCYINRSSLVLAQTAEVNFRISLVLAHLHRHLMLRYSGTCTDSWCYVTRPSNCTSAHSLCNVTRSLKILYGTSIDVWCYVTRSSLVLAQTVDVTLQDLLVYVRRHLMVSEGSSCTCADPWCYINRSSIVLAQTLAANYRIFSCTCTDAWCHMKRFFFVLAQSLDATLQDATCWARPRGPYYWGG